MHRIAIELRNTSMARYNSSETFNNPGAKMQSEEQSVSDLNSSTKSNLRGHWPPSFLSLVLGAVFAAGLGYIVLKTMYPIFVVPEDIANVGEGSPIEVYQRFDKAKFEIDGKNLPLPIFRGYLHLIDSTLTMQQIVPQFRPNGNGANSNSFFEELTVRYSLRPRPAFTLVHCNRVTHWLITA